MKYLYMKVADCIIRAEYRYDRCRTYFKDYLVEGEPEPQIISSVSDQELERTIEAVDGQISPELAEITALYRPVAKALPFLGGFVIHGACISYDGRGYLFTAPSGTGKSTHISLWRKHLGQGVGIVNGDKPIVTAKEEILIHGTPWAGKERWQRNVCVPLGGICLLNRGQSNRIRRADAEEFLPFLFRQTFLSPETDITLATLDLLDRVLRKVPVYHLECDISEEAVKTSFEAMVGKEYPKL